MEEQILEHTRWNCKCHIVFAPKFRRKITYGKYRKEMGSILRKLCEYKQIEILEANACVDHIHMCIKIPHSSQIYCFQNHGLLERKKQFDDIRAVL